MLTLALGANLGDRHTTLSKAREMITTRIGPIIQASTLLETKAWGLTDQPDFLNQVIVVAEQHRGAAAGAGEETKGAIAEKLHHILDTIQAIEAELGRQRQLHWGPRTCDIDIIFLDDISYEDERISLPHPWWKEREFVGGIIRSQKLDIHPR